jgi:Tol biopolymer transport system component
MLIGKTTYHQLPAFGWSIQQDGTQNPLRKRPEIYMGLPDGFAWSPDGTKIAFFGDGLTVMDADGSNIRKVDINAGAICNLMPPLWSPDSKKLAVIWSKTDAFCDSGVEAKGYSGTEIVLVDVESGKGYSLTPDQGRGYLDPAWSPDGTWLAFISAQIGEYQLWVANANGSNQHQLLKDQRPIRFPVWCKS